MQRRSATKSAHISPPDPTMGSDIVEKQPSRLHRKSLGVTNRIWLLLGGFAFIVLCTRYIASDSSRNQGRNRLVFNGAGGKTKNFLNVTEGDPNPFEFCPVFGPGDDLADKYGSLTLSKSRLHLGSGARVQRVIQKAMLGLPVTFSIIGSSVSACHGAGDDPLSTECYPARFLDWWNSVFPHPATEITNGAMRRVNSDYFGYCSAHHLPDVTDMVIVELDVDDDEDSLENFELLIRSLLLRPDQPAVVILGHFSPQIHEVFGYVGPEHWHNVVAQFYDVPHISIKPVIYPQYMEDKAAVMKNYYADPILSHKGGHQVMADILISYLQSQVCTTWSGATGHSYDALPLIAADGVNVKQPTDARGLFGGAGIRKGGAAGEEGVRPVPKPGADDDDDKDSPTHGLTAHLRVPATRMNTRPSDLEGRPFVDIAPFCASANDLVNPLPASIFAGSGWKAVHPRGSGAVDLYVASHYWEATMPGSKFRIPVQLGAGDVSLYYIREPAADIGAGSAVDCFVDDNVGGAKRVQNADKDVNDLRPTLFPIDISVSSGAHTVECRLVGEEGHAVPSFKIMGVFST